VAGIEPSAGNGCAESVDGNPAAGLKRLLPKAVMVVAHPDDEVLWLSSALSAVSRVVLCYNDYPALPELGEGRRAALAEYPLDTVCSLDLTESGAFDRADWPDPIPERHGLRLDAAPDVERAYRTSFELLVERLDSLLTDVPAVLTHNPWGEYGHEDHVQVYAAVKALQARHGFAVWYSNYVSNRSWPLMMRQLAGFDHRYETLNTNPVLAEALMSLYRRHGCWTWFDGYRWPETETLFCDPHAAPLPEAGRFAGNFPVHALRVDFGSVGQAKPRARWSRLLRRC
jgi:LmbE family N-acetylglucosaminyl deacetylase